MLIILGSRMAPGSPNVCLSVLLAVAFCPAKMDPHTDWCPAGTAVCPDSSASPPLPPGLLPMTLAANAPRPTGEGKPVHTVPSKAFWSVPPPWATVRLRGWGVVGEQAAAPCIDCRGTGVSVAWSTEAYPLATCTSCGLAYAANWPACLENGAQFHEGNIAFYEAMEEDPRRTRLDTPNLRRVHEILDRLADRTPARSLLDVGCGKGEAVATAVAAGWDACGIDLAPGAIRIAQGNGLPCEEMDFFSPELDAKRYGLIYMSEFLEHVPDPSRFLARAHELLLDGGLLYITTPNYSSLGRRVLLDGWSAFFTGHVLFFTRASLTSMAKRTGFGVEKVETGGVSVSALRALASIRGGAPAAIDEQYRETKAVREALYGSRWGRAAKRAADPVVGISGLGETLKATLVRR